MRPSDSEQLAPGQLGFIRVGVDRRSVAERNGAPPLELGIYAVCEVESSACLGTGAIDEFWADDAARAPGWPTVKLRYIETFLGRPLTIETIRAEAPDLSPLLLNGFQAASFPIPDRDFHRVMELLGERLDELETSSTTPPANAADIAELEDRYLRASPEVKERISRVVERGPVGLWAKRINGHRCQICAALGVEAVGFMTRKGHPYVEAHHVMPVARGEVGSLALSNIMTVCANHHRQLHYGEVEVVIAPASFEVEINSAGISVPRLGTSAEPGDS